MLALVEESRRSQNGTAVLSDPGQLRPLLAELDAIAAGDESAAMIDNAAGEPTDGPW